MNKFDSPKGYYETTQTSSHCIAELVGLFKETNYTKITLKVNSQCWNDMIVKVVCKFNILF